MSKIRKTREEFLETIRALRSAIVRLRTPPDVSPRLATRSEESPLWSAHGFRALGKTMTQGLLVADADDRIVYANDAAAELLGVAARDVIGRLVRDLVDPASHTTFDDRRANWHQSRTDRFEVAFRVAEGPPRVALASVRPLLDGRGRFAGSFLVLTDASQEELEREKADDSEPELLETLEQGTGLLYVRRADHELTYVSPSVKSFFGLAPEDRLGSWRELVTSHAANASALEAARRAGETGHRLAPYEVQMQRRDGQTLWIEVSEVPLVEEGRVTSIVGTLTDVTSRRRMAELLRVERDLGSALGSVRTLAEAFRLALDAALRLEEIDAGGVYRLEEESGDLVLAEQQGFSERYARAAARIPATPGPGSMLRRASGRGLERVDDEARREGLRATLEVPILYGGRLLACLVLASRKVETVLPAVVDALRTIGSQLAPVIARFEAQESLERSESTLRSLVASAPAAIGLVRNRAFQWVNDHITQQTGYPARELLGRSARLLYATEAEFVRVDLEVSDQVGRSGIGTVETKWKRRDGVVIDVLLSASALDPQDPAAGMVFTAWDVTKRNRAEAERLRLERQVQEAQKLESLGMLAGGVAHDFNNILHAILGHAGLAGKTPTDEERVGAHLTAIENAASRAGDLCRQMLAYAGRGAYVVERVRLGEIVRDLADMIDVTLSKKTELRLDLEGDTQPIEADPSQMRQVVLNLITNAAEAIGEKPGLVRVTVAPSDYTEERLHLEYWQSGLRAGTYVALTVEDTGCGMDTKTRERIFEPFFSTKLVGRGLGLAAIQGIVRGHGGAIRVVSEEGQGTSFTVLFPAAVGAQRPRPVLEARSPASPRQGLVLLAEDEERVRELGVLMLESAGFEVLSVADGLAAVDAFRERARDIQCAILDLTMPELDGAEAFRALREIDPNVPVILCSGYTAQELDHRFDGDKPSGFLAKPFKAEELLRMLNQVLPVPS